MGKTTPRLRKKGPPDRVPSLRTGMEMLASRLGRYQTIHGNHYTCRLIDYLLWQIKDDVDIDPLEELMRKTYTIEVKIDFDDNKRHDIMRKLMRKAARTVVAQAQLIADNRAPTVGFTCDDFFEGGTVESLTDDIGSIPELPDYDKKDETPEE